MIKLNCSKYNGNYDEINKLYLAEEAVPSIYKRKFYFKFIKNNLICYFNSSGEPEKYKINNLNKIKQDFYFITSIYSDKFKYREVLPEEFI